MATMTVTVMQNLHCKWKTRKERKTNLPSFVRIREHFVDRMADQSLNLVILHRYDLLDVRRERCVGFVGVHAQSHIDSRLLNGFVNLF